MSPRFECFAHDSFNSGRLDQFSGVVLNGIRKRSDATADGIEREMIDPDALSLYLSPASLKEDRQLLQWSAACRLSHRD
jgi:hypothetical protein